MNLLGRFIYIESIDGKKLDTEIERKFLTFTWFLLNVGWIQLVDCVVLAVEEEINDISVTDLSTYQSMTGLFDKIKNRISTSDVADFLLPKPGKEYLVLAEGDSNIPKDDPRVFLDEQLNDILVETRDLLACDDFKSIFDSSLDLSFQLVHKTLEPLYFNDSAVNLTGLVESAEVRVAKVVPVISQVAHQVFNGVPNQFISVISGNEDLKKFSAVIYSSF